MPESLFGQIGLLLGFSVTFLTLLGFAWRGGHHAAEVKSVKDTVVKELTETNRKLDGIYDYIRGQERRDGEITSWKEATDKELARVSDRAEVAAARGHDALNTVHRVLGKRALAAAERST